RRHARPDRHGRRDRRHEEHRSFRRQRVRMHTESRFLGTRASIALGVYVTCLNIALLYALIRMTPAGVEAGVLPHLPASVRYWAAAAVAGAFGASIPLATAFADAVGNRRLSGALVRWLVTLPFAGAATGPLYLLLLETLSSSGARSAGGVVQGAWDPASV